MRLFLQSQSDRLFGLQFNTLALAIIFQNIRIYFNPKF